MGEKELKKTPVVVPVGMMMDVIQNEILNHAVALMKNNNVPMELLPYILDSVENKLLKNNNKDYAIKYMEANGLLGNEVVKDGTSNNIPSENQKISRTDKFTVVANSHDYLRARFVFMTDEWQGIKTAIFRRGTTKTPIILDNDECYVPWEFLAGKGIGYVSAFAGGVGNCK